MRDKNGLKWDFADSTDFRTCIMSGMIGEDAGLELLIPEISEPVRIDLHDVSRINSTGVREWLAFIEAIDKKGPHRLTRCSIAVVGQLNMFDNFKGSSLVESVMGPYYCEECGHQETVEIKIEGETPVLSLVKCPECGHEEMSFDELESRYFYFIG